MKLTSRTFDPFHENLGEENRGYCAKEVSHVSLVIALVYRFAYLNFRPVRGVIRHPMVEGKELLLKSVPYVSIIISRAASTRTQ